MAFALLDETMKDIEAENMLIIFNKALEGEDDEQSVQEYYEEAHKQSESKYLPKELKKSQFLLVNR